METMEIVIIALWITWVIAVVSDGAILFRGWTLQLQSINMGMPPAPDDEDFLAGKKGDTLVKTSKKIAALLSFLGVLLYIAGKYT